MAAAVVTSSSSGAGGGGGTGSSAAATTSRFAAACGALSQYVRAAEAERAHHARAAAPLRPLPLMPGADVDAGHQDDEMTIVYGGRVLVLDHVPADTAAGLLRLAATEAARAADLLPVARKASLQRFMEKRRVRAAARGEPYRHPDAGSHAHAACPDHLKLAL